ncbi:MAG: HAD-IC family P-type ATPase [Prevotella sp.]|nr:HAD-IC family P-type ATPase [Prevotella sp.]
MKKTFPVAGMACSACSAHVEETLRALPGVREASVSLLLRTAAVDFDESATSAEAIREAVSNIGYDLIIDGSAAAEVEQRSYKVLKHRVLLAWVCAAAVMAVSMRWVVLGGEDLSNQVMLLLALLSIVVCGRTFYVSAFRSMLHLRANMDTLVTLSTAITFIFSAFNTFCGAAVWGARGIEWHTYFDTPAMILAFVLTGRLLEERAKDGTTKAVRELTGIAPTTARLVKDDGEGGFVTSEIPIATIRRGDRLEVRAGWKVPVDGVVASAESFMTADKAYIDESMLTGEPAPAGKAAGDRVFAGTIVRQGSCIVEARLTGSDTAVEQIIAIVRRSLESKSPLERATDRLSAIFAPAVLAAALVTFLAWRLIGGEGQIAMAIMSAMAVVVVACPCAMGLATPTALMVGIGNAAKKHILIKDAAALETLRRVSALVVDKTGTLTVPNPNIDFTKGEKLPFEEREQLKENVAEAINSLQQSDIQVFMMSGDNAAAAEYWAKKAGIKHWQSGVKAGDKEALVRQLQRSGHVVAMLGDGINDTQALAAADVSIAVGRGTDVAIDIAQVVIPADDLSAVPAAIALSTSTVRLIWQNLFWAFIYNIVCIPLAAGVLYAFGIAWSIPPMWAAALMALSSVSVVLNSLRLRAR